MSSSAIFLVIAVLALLIRRVIADKRRYRLPPGPKPSMLWGNLFDIPAVEPWKRFREYSSVYGQSFACTSRVPSRLTDSPSPGSLVYLSLPTQPTIVLGTAKVALELLEKRSQIYSDRLLTVMDEL